MIKEKVITNWIDPLIVNPITKDQKIDIQKRKSNNSLEEYLICNKFEIVFNTKVLN